MAWQSDLNISGTILNSGHAGSQHSFVEPEKKNPEGALQGCVYRSAHLTKNVYTQILHPPKELNTLSVLHNAAASLWNSSLQVGKALAFAPAWHLHAPLSVVLITVIT